MALRATKLLIFGREFLNDESGRKTLSKLQRPETGRASSWELNCMHDKKNRKIQFSCSSLESLVQDTKFQSQYEDFISSSYFYRVRNQGWVSEFSES